ncbi:unnamed protein product [Trifolium pratense]|uniref:Uncharacterized protein n=1 Tax=Trifolium pratense TaxID=57577 RepID=A0ACB0M201_TRIPR|nr:unnamed protein product [Trifolium pratense]
MVILLLLQHQHHQTCDATTITNNQTYCPPSSCGKIKSIMHPFRLKNDPTSCGDPRYELSCENNMTMLTLFSGKYYVKAINYKNYTIRLVDPGIQEDDCSSIPHNYLYTSNFTSYYRYLEEDPYETKQYRIISDNSTRGLPMFQHVIYMNCSNPVRDDPAYADTACCINGGHVYAIAGDLKVDFIAKVSDFGLAKLYPLDNSIVTLTAARGTVGYMAPELFYKNIGGVSYKADVYSFGMLLMEIANRRRNLNSNADKLSQIFFPYWIYNELIEEREIETLGKATDDEKKNVIKMFIVALWCIQLNPSDRPSMDKVIEMLEGATEDIDIPPKPSPYPSEIVQDNEISSSESASDEDVTGSISFLEETTEDPLL